jgi:hypothetical protein
MTDDVYYMYSVFSRDKSSQVAKGLISHQAPGVPR